MAKTQKQTAEQATAPETDVIVNDAAANNTPDNVTSDDAAALAEENSVLRAMVAEQAKQLAAHEKITSEVLTQVQGRTARVIAGCIHKGVKYTKQEVATNDKVCAELVAMKSDLIQFVN